MKDENNNALTPVISYVQSLHLYSRREMSEMLGSSIHYGDGTYGDALVLAKAKTDHEKHQKQYQEFLKDKEKSDFKEPEESEFTKNAQHEFGSMYAFKDKSFSGEVTEEEMKEQMAEADMSLEASDKPFAEFLGKDYLVDISPKHVHIIFPDITFKIHLEMLYTVSWELVREELQGLGLVDKDIAFITGEAVSLDQLRNKLKNETMTDGELTELRKKMYGLAYAINATMEEQINAYE